ncbi:B12-binding domain-containing radical SAM protein [Streptomyces sp. enrichment culture]|uniref:B12-binding domain-containing radical SAM protein n=1 Tax=Streptomyces sp. enrichment culture TaxID=1795815 RepID=UPI003F549265
MGKKTVLVNPPLWNAYAPHLAVPLLLGDLRARGYEAAAYDLSIECVDWMLSEVALTQLRDKAYRRRAAGLRDEWARQRALLVAPAAIAGVEEAKARLRSLATLREPEVFHSARRTLRDALWLVSGAFPDCEFDLVSNTGTYAAESTAQVLAATEDPAGNPYRWAFDRMLDRDLFLNPAVGVVGVSMSADTQLIAGVTFLRMLRDMRPDVHVVLGGNYATRLVDRWQRRHPLFDYVDTVVTGEGEGALAAVVDALEGPRSRGSDFREKIPGAVWDDHGILRRTPRQSADITASALPAYTDLPLHKYLAPGPVLPVFASRSCPWDCAFCSIPFASNSFRQRPPDAVVDEIHRLRTEAGSRFFMFVDEIMSLRTLRGVAEALVRTSAGIHWYGETRFARGLDEELAGLLHASGCRRMNFGLESASQRVLDLMRKGTRIEDACANIEAMLKAGVPLHLFVIHGFPGETEEEAAQTVAFAEAVRRLSVETYGVAHTTWGGSPFVLDVHSPVGTRPDAFGVRVEPPAPENDLSLWRNYTVGSGMSPEDGLRVAETAAGSAGDTNVWFRAARDPLAREIEEFTFLRASAGAPLPEAPAVPLFDWPPPDLEARLTLDPEVTSSQVPWPATETDTGPANALYHPRYDRFLQLNARNADWRELDGVTWRELETWLADRECHYLGTDPATTATLLVRHGFLVPSRRRAERVPGRLRPEIGIAVKSRDGIHSLTNPVTGVTVRLRGAAIDAWHRWSRGEDVASDPEVTAALARFGFLYRGPAADRPPRPVYARQGEVV